MSSSSYRRGSVRSILFAMVGVALSWCGVSNAQGDYPNRPVKIVVPYPAGGTTDAITRMYAKELGDKLGQQFIVENRPGGGTNLGAEAVARSSPDGYTLFVVQAASHGVNPSLFAKLNYDPVKDFSAVGQMARTTMFLIINAGLPFNSVQDLVSYARTNPGKLNYASQGNGSPGHLGGALLAQRTGIDAVHVPYKGAAQALTDLVSGQVQFGFLSFDGMAAGMVKEGKLRVLAVAAPERWPTAPQVPSMAEFGVKDFDVPSYFGLSAPAKTPEAVLDRLNQAMLEIGRREDIRKRTMDMGLVPFSMSRSEMTAFVTRTIDFWKSAVSVTKVKVD